MTRPSLATALLMQLVLFSPLATAQDDSKSVDELIKALADSDENVRRDAAYELANAVRGRRQLCRP